MSATTDLMTLAHAEAKNPSPPAAVRHLFAEPSGTSLDMLAVVLMSSWRSGGSMPWARGHSRPMLDLPRAEWVEMFRRVGYMSNVWRSPDDRPSEPVRLYRAATRDYRDGLSWAPTPDGARMYLWSPSGLDHRLYVADVRPEWMLGRFDAAWARRDVEVIADVPQHAIRPYAEPGQPYRVLFVCVGNICRSPLAELVMREMAAEHGLNIEAASVGVSAINGDPMDPGTLATAERHGLDGSAHVARRLGLTDRTADCVVSLDPFAARIVRMVVRGSGAALMERPVPNPWRCSDDVQEEAYRLIVDVCHEVCADARAALAPEAAS